MRTRSERALGVAASRLRMPLNAAAIVAIACGWFLGLPSWWTFSALGLFVAGLALYFRLGTPRGAPVDVVPPVEGRWVAVNSPASRVPSHRVHAWAQTYAIDLVAEPSGGGCRPGTAWRPITRRPEDFPGFGEPILAPVSGTVVRRLDVMRDHRSRTSPLALAFFMAETVREFLGPPGILGNHLVIHTDDDAYVLLAHLRRHSIRVRKGETVRVGEVVAECGNSGNSTEPHIHLQAMDKPSTWIAAGRPITFDRAPPPADNEPLPNDQRGPVSPGARSRTSCLL